MLVILASVCLVLLLLSLFVVGSVAGDLLAARSALEGSLEGIDRDEVAEARDHLEAAASDLDGWVAETLGLIPVVGANLHAIEDVTDNAIPVLDSAIELQDAVDELDEQGLVSGGRVRVEEIEALAGPLDAEVESLGAFAEALDGARSGALAPPLWDAIERLRRRVVDLHEDAIAVDRAVELSGALLGEESERTYVLLLMNNAELRGGGGIVAGLGSLTIDDGEVRLGATYTREQLDVKPRVEVPAPAEYMERFGQWWPNTSLWYNAVMTPHFPDAALVSARLFAEQKGIDADGVLGVDPRGLAALTPPGVEIEVPGRDYTLNRDELADWIYSDAYEDFANQRIRRAALLLVGRNAIEAGLQEGFGGKEGLDSIGAAFGGQHLKFVSFDEAEASVLEDAGVSGALDPETRDTMLVTVQNYGGGDDNGSKLDFWTDRHLRHGCIVEGDGAAECATEVTLDNTVPDGLTRYVAGKPYGLLRDYTEVYIPLESKLQEVKLDGEPFEYRPEEQGDLLSIGVNVEVPQGEQAAIEVAYTLPPGDESYSLTMIPQPLTSDATVDLRLRVPNDWTIVGAGDDSDTGEVTWKTTLDKTIEVHAFPDGRTGIPGIWEGLKDFWHDPLF